MLKSRSAPQVGIQRTSFRMASSAFPLSPFLSSEMNHCSVARNSVGFLHRQQCGYSWLSVTSATRAPDSFRSAMIFGLASQTVSPAKCATSGTKRPSSSTGL